MKHSNTELGYAKETAPNVHYADLCLIKVPAQLSPSIPWSQTWCFALSDSRNEYQTTVSLFYKVYLPVSAVWIHRASLNISMLPLSSQFLKIPQWWNPHTLKHPYTMKTDTPHTPLESKLTIPLTILCIY